MGMTKRPQIGNDGTIVQELARDKVGQCQQGGQEEVCGLQLPLQGHVNEIKSRNWACIDYENLHIRAPKTVSI